MRNYDSMTLEQLQSFAAGDDVEALYYLAKRYETGDGVEQNAAEAEKYYIFAAQLGHGEALYALGQIREREGNLVKATECYKTGMLSGNRRALVAYARLLLPDDENEAIGLLTDAADEGDNEARLLLIDYYRSCGNEDDAHFWESKRVKAPLAGRPRRF